MAAQRFLRENPAFVECCYAAHKAGFLLPYLAGSTEGFNGVSWRDVDRYALVISELFEHSRFRPRMTDYVRNGIVLAWNAIMKKQ